MNLLYMIFPHLWYYYEFVIEKARRSFQHCNYISFVNKIPILIRFYIRNKGIYFAASAKDIVDLQQKKY